METNNHVAKLNDHIEECNKAIFQIDPLMLKVENINDIMKEINNYETLSYDDCERISIKLTQHSYYTQARVNKVKALIDYIEDQMRSAIAEDVAQYKGVSWDYAEMLAIKQNSFAREMHVVLREYKAIFNSARNQVDIIRELSKRIEGLKYSKKI